MGKNPHWKTSGSGCFQIPSNKRPLTVYMNKGELDDPVVDAANPAGKYETSDQPVFKCPSDYVSAQWQWSAYGAGKAKETYSAYNDVGTSYQMNFYWWHQTDKVEGTDFDGDGIIEPTAGACQNEPIASCPSQSTKWPCRFRQGRNIWRKYQYRNTARFVTLGEDPFDFAVVNQTQELGFHRKFSRHNLAFLDGHADSLDVDTRQPYGTHWTVIDEEIEAAWW
jgi:hypothetical protein